MNAKDDFIIAFFPCTHFCDANQLQYRLLIGGHKRDLDKKSVSRLILRNKERARFFEIYLKFCFICKQRGIKTIIENPASSGDKNYLVQFSPVDVAYYEKDRSLFGDNFKKPTNYFAINFEMNAIIIEVLTKIILLFNQYMPRYKIKPIREANVFKIINGDEKNDK